MASKVNYLTPEGQKNLEEELDQLHSTRRREVAERIHKASETGGTVDNAEYDEAKNEQAFVEGRISDLEQILSGAVVGSAGGHEPGAVDFGSSVTVTPRTRVGSRSTRSLAVRKRTPSRGRSPWSPRSVAR